MNETFPYDSPTLTPSREADMVQYGAVSPLAVAALLLGLFSALALTSALLWVVPIVAVLTAALALQRIASSEGSLIGRNAALIGLTLALLFGSLAITKSLARGWVLRSEARQFGDAWIQLVRDGDLQRAHQLHKPASERQLSSSSLERFYAINDEARDELETFFSGSPLKEIAALPTSATISLQHAQATTFDDREHVALHYEVDSGDAVLPFVLVVQRATTDAGGLWSAVLVSPPKEDAS